MIKWCSAAATMSTNLFIALEMTPNRANTMVNSKTWSNVVKKSFGTPLPFTKVKTGSSDL